VDGEAASRGPVHPTFNCRVGGSPAHAFNKCMQLEFGFSVT